MNNKHLHSFLLKYYLIYITIHYYLLLFELFFIYTFYAISLIN